MVNKEKLETIEIKYETTNKNNVISKILYIIAIVEFFCVPIICLALGNELKIGYDIPIFFVASIIVSFVNGIFICGFAEIIQLLQNIKDKNSRNIFMHLNAMEYSNLYIAEQYIKEQQYVLAYDLLEIVIIEMKNTNQEIVKLAVSKQNEIKEKMIRQVILQAQEEIDNQYYSSAKIFLEKYKDLGNQTIVDMYNTATNELNKIVEKRNKSKE